MESVRRATLSTSTLRTSSVESVLTEQPDWSFTSGSTAAHVCCDNGHETQDDLGIHAEPTALYTDYHVH